MCMEDVLDRHVRVCMNLSSNETVSLNSFVYMQAFFLASLFSVEWRAGEQSFVRVSVPVSVSVSVSVSLCLCVCVCECMCVCVCVCVCMCTQSFVHV